MLKQEAVTTLRISRALEAGLGDDDDDDNDVEEVALLAIDPTIHTRLRKQRRDLPTVLRTYGSKTLS